MLQVVPHDPSDAMPPPSADFRRDLHPMQQHRQRWPPLATLRQAQKPREHQANRCRGVRPEHVSQPSDGRAEWVAMTPPSAYRDGRPAARFSRSISESGMRRCRLSSGLTRHSISPLLMSRDTLRVLTPNNSAALLTVTSPSSISRSYDDSTQCSATTGRRATIEDIIRQRKTPTSSLPTHHRLVRDERPE
jgi:hypothetical protein